MQSPSNEEEPMLPLIVPRCEDDCNQRIAVLVWKHSIVIE